MVSSSEFIRGYTEMIILSLLLEEDDYIYNLSNKINERSKGILCITNPSLVISLKKMCDEGKVNTYNKLNEKNVNRKYYSITELGKSFYYDNKEDYLLSLKMLEILIGGVKNEG